MSEIIGPPKDVALFKAAQLIKELFADIESNLRKPKPITRGLRKRVVKVQSEIMQAILSDAIPPELLENRKRP